jgi:hypothetical protein
MKYEKYQRNHVTVPGREKALGTFIRQEYKGMQHKFQNAFSSNSEDALTWSCFDTLENLPSLNKIKALDEILMDSYEGNSPLSFADLGIIDSDIKIHVGKKYTGNRIKESTEVDASIEASGVLIFIEAKLYSAVTAASPPQKPYDQIARKLRIGLDAALETESKFYFIFLDIAPLEKMNQRRTKSEAMEKSSGGYNEKWRSAWLFSYYKKGRANSLRPLEKIIEGIVDKSFVPTVAANMGWLTWADLFKCTLRATINSI